MSASSLGSVALRTTAPAPSPKSTHVLLSDQSTHLLRASAPMITADFTAPLLKYCDAVTRAKTKPEHAAVRSIPTACLAPSLCAISVAVPNKSSGVEVARITSSTSSGSMPAESNACLAASTEMDARLSPAPTTHRRRMPVRCVIHSSLVSTISDKSSLLTTASGTALPVPAILIPATAPVPPLGAVNARRTMTPARLAAIRKALRLLR
mmetsp:Transcript_58163/g.138451  ORF Transcript_58163/g.138451 Transcript_58163/m.138451 type:complete len:209 (+) Transcript_58163:632-1258(+)